MKKQLTLIYFLLSALAFSQSKDFENKINALISFKVDTISVSALQKSKANFLVLDAREMDEFKTSHIEGAQCVGFDYFNADTFVNAHPDKNQPIAVYCSIGVRSEQVGLKLKERGYTNVKNVYGGIFEWSNQEKPLVDIRQNSTKDVHTFSKEWSVWLEKGNKIYDK